MSTKEKWKQIKINGEKTHYSVSTFGRIRNDNTNKILKVQKQKKYDMVTISHNNKSKSLLVSRLVACAFIPIPDKYLKKGLTEKDLEVDHIRDGDIKNHDDNSVYNLQWITKTENIKKAKKAGLYSKEGISKGMKKPEWAKKGSKNPFSKYSEEQVHEICKLLVENKLNIQQISEKVGVKKTFVHDIKQKRAWKHISEEYDFSNYNKKVGFKYSENTMEELDKLISEGKNNNEIREQLGLDNNKTTSSLISKHRSKLGKNVSIRYQYSDQFLKEIDKLILEGKSNKDIRKKMNLENNDKTAVLISSHRRKLNVPTKKELQRRLNKMNK